MYTSDRIVPDLEILPYIYIYIDHEFYVVFSFDIHITFFN